MTTMRERIAMEIFDKIIARIDDGREPEDICFEAADAVLAEIDLPSIKAAARAEAMEESDAVKDVKAERRRQIEVEGWDAEHDARHAAGDLADAAACYAATDRDLRYGVPFGWPWGDKWWKPTTRRRDLVKAGALILAEIERLDRAALAKATE